MIPCVIIDAAGVEIPMTEHVHADNHAYKGRLPLYLNDQMAKLQAEYRQLDARRPDRLPRPVPRPAPAPTAIDISKLAILRFPPPPIPGTATIIPLTSFSDFQEESTHQSNCLGTNYSYLTRVLRGEIYVYRVMAPEQHTLCIVKRDNNCWQIAELRQAKNQPATETADAAVRNWLSANQISL